MIVANLDSMKPDSEIVAYFEKNFIHFLDKAFAELYAYLKVSFLLERDFFVGKMCESIILILGIPDVKKHPVL